MKLRPVTKLDKRNKTTSKKLTMTSFQQIVTSLPFFQFMAKSVKLAFTLIAIFYLTIPENRTKKSVKTQLSYYCLE